jgi:photosystem II stability/assembly factor-like uncharacterized protein
VRNPSCLSAPTLNIPTFRQSPAGLSCLVLQNFLELNFPSDGGATWEDRNVLPESHSTSCSVGTVFQQVFFVDNGMRGWVVAGGGFLYQTEDAGNSWQELDLIDALRDK